MASAGSASALNALPYTAGPHQSLLSSVLLFFSYLFGYVCVHVCPVVQLREQFARVGSFYHSGLRDKI